MLITGSRGFIGSHLAALLSASTPESGDCRTADVSSRDAMRALAQEWRPRSVVHLAAKGTVVAPVASIPTMAHTCLAGLANLLAEFRPSRVIFASTCAVYGNAPGAGAQPDWDDVHPVSVYGLIKAAAELTVSQWAAETGGTAMIVRMGNVVGRGGKGLIGHLIQHAVRYPDGAQLMQMRGGGRIVRDYVPVDYAVRVMGAALHVEAAQGTAETYNVGSGTALTNGEVAEIVKLWLRERGYRLNIVFSDDAGAGEAWSSVLRTGATGQRFNVQPPTADDVRTAIVATAESHLTRISEETASPTTA